MLLLKNTIIQKLELLCIILMIKHNKKIDFTIKCFMIKHY